MPSSTSTEPIARDREREVLLRYVQLGLVGLIDGTLSTLAPVFAAAVLAGSRAALLVGLATALGAGLSMALSEALSDDGQSTGRGSALVRGAVTGLKTTLGGTCTRCHSSSTTTTPPSRSPVLSSRSSW